MRRIIATAAACSVLWIGTDGFAATKVSKSRNSIPGVSDATVAGSGGGVTATVGDVAKKLLNRMNLHLVNPMEVRGAVESAIEEEVRERLVLRRITGKGYDRELEPETRVIRNRFVAGMYTKQALPVELEPSEAEVAERSPKAWVETRFREITLTTREDAEKVRAVLLADPGKFVELVREKSVGPKVDQDGLTFYIRPLPFNFIFSPKDDAHLFSLKPGELSWIVQSGLGYTIYTPVETRDIPPDEVLAKKRKLGEKIIGEKIQKRIDGVRERLKPLNRVADDESVVYRMVLDHFEGKGPDRTEVVRVGDLSLTFFDLTRLEKLYTWPKPNLTDPVEYMERLRQMVRQLILPEALLAFDAKEHGFSLGEREARFADEKVQSWLKDRLFEERISSRARVTDEEVRDHFLRNRESFRRWKKVDYRVIRTKTLEKMQAVFRKIEKDGDFDAGFRYAASRKINEETGGGIRRGVAWDNVPAEMQRVLPNLKEGKFSTILKYPDGYIVTVLDRVVDWEDPSFEETRENIRAALKRDKTNLALKEFYDDIAPGLKIETNPAAVDHLVGRMEEIKNESMRRLREKGVPPGHGGAGGKH